ncbi:MAG: MinD/ParA family protein, partial [Schumannella sp.]|nr:MinD/ParA family protein [Schumannella sp.]
AAPPLPEPHPPVSRYGRRYSAARPSHVSSRPSDVDASGTADKVRKAGKARKKPTPEGFLPRFVYGLTMGLLNLGDSAAVRARKELEARIAGPTHGGAAFIPVISRKGGVGATTVTTILGMALADVRDDGVLAVDAHPDRGTLADRVDVEAPASVRDFVRRAHRIESPDQLANLVAHDPTGLDVLASDTDPDQSHPFSARSYGIVADVAERFYSVVLTDGASGVLEPTMHAALERADGVVLVTGGTAEEARLASETIDWLFAHDLGGLAKRAVVAINTATAGTAFDELPQIEAHFRSRVRDVVRIPYDEELAAGSPVRYGALRPYTRDSARDLAALVMDAAAASPVAAA